MDQENKKKIAVALHQKGVKLPCPRCSSSNFEVVGQTLLSLNEDPNVFNVGGPAIPSAIVACSNCGFISLHALGPLNLMPNNPESNWRQLRIWIIKHVKDFAVSVKV